MKVGSIILLIVGVAGMAALVTAVRINSSSSERNCQAIRDDRALVRVLVRSGAERFHLPKRRTDRALSLIRDSCDPIDTETLLRLLRPGAIPEFDRRPSRTPKKGRTGGRPGARSGASGPSAVRRGPSGHSAPTAEAPKAEAPKKRRPAPAPSTSPPAPAQPTEPAQSAPAPGPPGPNRVCRSPVPPPVCDRVDQLLFQMTP